MKEFVEQYGNFIIAVAIGGAMLITFATIFLLPHGVFYDFIGRFVAFL